MRLNLAPLQWSFLKLIPYKVGVGAARGRATVDLNLDLMKKVGIQCEQLIIENGRDVPIVSTVGNNLPPFLAFSNLRPPHGVVIFGRKCLGILNFPENWRDICIFMRGELVDGDPTSLKHLLAGSGFLLSACLIVYSLSQVDWQNLTLPQSLASVALCGLGMDPNLVA